MPNYRQIEKLVEARRKKSSDGCSWTLAELRHDLAQWLRQNVDQMEPDEVSAEWINSWTDQRRIKFDQPGLDLGDQVLADGRGRHRYAKDAVETDWLEMLVVRGNQFESQRKAWKRDEAAIHDIVRKYRDPRYAGCRTYADIVARDRARAKT